MTYAVTIEYRSDPEAIAQNRPDHREYLRGLVAANKLVISGPFADDSGALIVYNADDEAEVERLIHADPFCRAGVFQTWVIRPWKIVMASPGLTS
ncbi:MAG: hypothetical protein RL328_2059 [Acidobacteriota bacterium]|jgi:uncharacterized protein YciI